MSPASNCDRLSDMPDEILHHILSFLPTLESVRTSVLARRWCHLWHCVPTLHFDVDDDLLKQPIVNETEAAYKQAEKINQFFDRRDAAAPLLRFHLHFRYICLTFPFSINPWIRYGRYQDVDQDVDINPWIRYARSHDVRDMTVRIDYMTDPPPICMFFDLPSVEALDLRCFCLTDSWALPRRTALSKLKVLSLLISHGAFSSQCLETLLSSCPTLQELTVHYEQCSRDLAITAPNLRRLTIIDSSRSHSCNSYHAQVTCPKLEYLHLTIRMLLKLFKGHLPSLREAFVVFSYSRPMSTEQLEQIFISLGSVTKLTLRLKCYPSCRSEDPRSFPIFHRLKQLKFSAAMGEDYIKQVLLRFVGCSPLLSSLQVIDEQEACDYLLRTEDYDRSIRLLPPIKQPVDHLQTVCVKGISNAETRSDVLKLLSSLVREWARVVVIT